MSWTRVARSSEIPEGKSLLVPVNGAQIAVFRTGGKLFAIDAVCPHRGGPLDEGAVENGEVICPWHAWSFNVETGECTTAPGTNQKTYPVKVQGEDVLVDA
ncbi:MAG TPA: nitrite reductase small subunit NirD [Candidatus Eisenbacteria bacterium]|jgi:nitrite reductase (NADH) small subunit|nr:nitrite reductase small subunit NirD [Candidatus Eisenbacteria bacterium]